MEKQKGKQVELKARTENAKRLPRSNSNALISPSQFIDAATVG
jgi:hypothetical protein